MPSWTSLSFAATASILPTRAGGAKPGSSPRFSGRAVREGEAMKGENDEHGKRHIVDFELTRLTSCYVLMD